MNTHEHIVQNHKQLFTLICTVYFRSFFFSKHSYSVDCVIFSSCVPDSGKEHEKFLIVIQLFSIKSFLQVLQPLKEAFHFCLPVAMSLALTFVLAKTSVIL